jgi:hypothetical protein
MRRGNLWRGVSLAWFLGVAVGVGAMPLWAQGAPGELSRTQFGIGYVANAPSLMAGGGGYVLFPAWGGVGLYVDAKFDLHNPSDDVAFRPGTTPEELEAEIPGVEFIKRETSWRSFNVGLVRPLTPALMAYAGAGYSRASYYRLYQEVSMDVGRAIWVEAPDDEETRVNLMLGILVRVNATITSQFGFETQPRGMSIGASLRLPRW